MVEFLTDLFAAHWGKLLGCLTFLAFIPAYLQARYTWRSRRFLGRLNFSINFLEGNTLKFRTLRETNLEDAMLKNAHAIRIILKARRFGNPSAFLLFKDREEAWTILATLLNELSTVSTEGFVARSMGLPTRSEWFYMGITCEKHADLKSTKFRVMLITKQMLETVNNVDSIQFEQSGHHLRLTTLRQMWQILQDANLEYNIMQVELTVRA